MIKLELLRPKIFGLIYKHSKQAIKRPSPQRIKRVVASIRLLINLFGIICGLAKVATTTAVLH